MGKKILDSKALYIILSVVISVVLWFYVINLDGNEKTQPIRNIPITFVGLEELEDRGLMIVGDPPTASITVTATPAVLAKLTNDSVRLVVDLTTTSIERAAEYTLAYTVSLPAGVSRSQVQFPNGDTGNVTFTVAEYREREVEIRGKFIGTAAEGYLPGDESDFIFTPGTMTISGQAELVNQVSYVLVTIDGKNLTDTVSGDYAYQLIGASGTPLEDLDVECSSETVHTTFPILATAEVSLTLELKAGGGVSADEVRYTLSTDKITVAGSKNAVAAITAEGAIKLATIDLATVHDGEQLTLPIPLTDELTNISGINEVTVTIELPSDLVTETFQVTDINYINPPSGWRIDVITQEMTVEIRGKRSLMDDVTAGSIRVVADLQEINLAAGQYSVTATVYLDSVGTMDQIGVVGTGYKVVVSMQRG